MSYTKGEKHLNNVCIVQKYRDSNKVLECQESFNKSKEYIEKAVLYHTDLLEACEFFVSEIKWGKENHPYEEDKNYLMYERVNKRIKQAISKAKGV